MLAPTEGTTAGPAGTHLLEVSDLHCSFGGVQAVDGASFTVREGTLTGLIGPNGAGKSTVLNAIGGQVRPTGGTISFAGRALGDVTPHDVSRAGITRTFQTANVFGRLTVLENLLMGAPSWRGETLLAVLPGKHFWRGHEAELVDKAQGILERFGLERLQNDYAGELSGGQRRLVEIMRALMAEPKLLLLDEPMAGINLTLARSIADLLLELRGEGVTMVMVEHDLHVVERICDPIVCMVQGRVLAEGSMAELRANQEVIDAYLQG
ncbi:MAG TPA: ABC transporter ATP-binding protein [Solirubrobacteraceae bacterium]|nr:ABC transporter ATP-binding protein [Solirubrobacteraceae bacterium]